MRSPIANPSASSAVTAIAHPGMRSSAAATSGNVCSGWIASGRAPAARAGARTSSPEAPDRCATHCAGHGTLRRRRSARRSRGSRRRERRSSTSSAARAASRGIQQRHVGQEPRRAIAGRTSARDGDDPMPGTTQQHRHRGPHASRADDRDVHRSEYANSAGSTRWVRRAEGVTGGAWMRTSSPPVAT